MTQTSTAAADDRNAREWYLTIQHHLDVLAELMAAPLNPNGTRKIGIRVQLQERRDLLGGAVRLARKQGVDVRGMR